MSKTQTRSGISYFTSMGITDSSSMEDKKAAYRALSMKYHPDRPTGNAAAFVAIKEAYEEMIKPPVQHRVHQEHRMSAYVRIDNYYINRHGDAVIDIIFRNMLFAYPVNGPLDNEYHWTLAFHNGGLLTIKKKDLRRSGYKVEIKFLPVLGNSVSKVFQFEDPRTGWEKLVDKVKNIF